MFRYVACVWNRDRPDACARVQSFELRMLERSGWSNVFRREGVSVFCAGIRPGSSKVCILPDSAGVLLGTVFEYSSDPHALSRKKTFSNAEVQATLAAQCANLPTMCWGRYVAVVHDRRTNGTCILRDPTGGLPCYSASHEGVELFFSCIDDLTGIDQLSFTVDHDFVAARVVQVFVLDRRTAINEVSQVLAGELVELSQGQKRRRFVWDPFTCASQHPLEDAQEAARTLRNVAVGCVRAWASCYPAVLHRLSGGLDSSIILGCLDHACASERITCVNYYSQGSDGDERSFARLAAERAGVELVEQERPAMLALGDMLKMSRSPAPTHYLGPLQTGRLEARLAEQRSATAIFGGGGGDQLFYQTQAKLATCDYVQLQGFNSELLRVALDAAHLEQCSIWAILRQAVGSSWSRRLGRRDRRVDQLSQGLASAETVEHVRNMAAFEHPLLRTYRHVPPGKMWHIQSLLFPQEFYDPLGQPGDPEHVEPLISQPIVELLLRTPTYNFIRGGWDRSIAREAFREDVPREIVRRRSKGGMEENVAAILAYDLATARELLLDGQLVKMGMIDRAHLEEVLSGRPSKLSVNVTEVFDHLCTEAWVRSWTEPRPQRSSDGQRDRGIAA